MFVERDPECDVYNCNMECERMRLTCCQQSLLADGSRCLQLTFLGQGQARKVELRFPEGALYANEIGKALTSLGVSCHAENRVER